MPQLFQQLSTTIYSSLIRDFGLVVDELPSDMEFVGAEAARGGVVAVVEEPGRLNGISGDASMVAERLDGEGVETLGFRLLDSAGVGNVEVVEFKSPGV